MRISILFPHLFIMFVWLHRRPVTLHIHLCLLLAVFILGSCTAPTRLEVLRAVNGRVRDGRMLSEDLWGRAGFTAPFVGPITDEDSSGMFVEEGPWSTRVKLAWDADHLFVLIESVGPQPDSPFTRHDELLHQADVVEVFLDVTGRRQRIVEIQANPGNVTADYLHVWDARPEYRAARIDGDFYKAHHRADHAWDRMTPGGPLETTVTNILGRKARESGYGWFAYRIGRGKLKPHSMYLLRIEYPEDKPRFCPVEIQTGQNYMDVGWKSGVGVDDPYDPWPLSGRWEWYDVIVPLDDETVGTGGTGTASAENGFWVYFMNKVRADKYYAMWSAGPVAARIKLYEIDPDKHTPMIRRPEGLPNRVLSLDWERQPDHDPTDLVLYAKLMGYNAISPLILKWHFANYSDPLNGYDTMVIDDRNYWSHADYDPASGKDAVSPYPGKKSQHMRYLEATKRHGIDYIPRIEWGGSKDLPEDARAIDVNGQPIKPNRFARWCGNLLNPLTWDDAKKLMDHLIKPYTMDNPQLTGVLWRSRCFRMPISYGPADIRLFSRETGTPLPPGREPQWAAWASGEMKTRYDQWWHEKRAQFHIKLAELLKSYRSDMTLYYYNWDPDKFGLILPDITAWAFVKNVIQPAPKGGRTAYEEERGARKKLTAEDYIHVMRTGNFGDSINGLNRADLGVRPDLYKDAPGIQIFAPVSYLCYADKPGYLNYFQTADGLAMSHCVSYDEIGTRSINPKYEGNMITPGGPAFSMALELLAYFYGDARTLNYTVYTYGRGFAGAHRRFAQAFLALPAIAGTVIDQGDKDVRVRMYASPKGQYVGVAYKGYAGKTFTVRLPAKPGLKVMDLVTGKNVASRSVDGALQFDVQSGPMELNAYLVK